MKTVYLTVVKMLAGGVVVLGCIGAVLGPIPAARAQPTTVAEDMAAAVGRYVAEKREEVVKEQSRRAIVAAYKKLYRSGADKRVLRVLGDVALSAEEIDKLADNMAKATVLGDPEGV